MLGAIPFAMPSSSIRFGMSRSPIFLLHHTDEMTAPFVMFTRSTRALDMNSSLSSPLARASSRPARDMGAAHRRHGAGGNRAGDKERERANTKTPIQLIGFSSSIHLSLFISLTRLVYILHAFDVMRVCIKCLASCICVCVSVSLVRTQMVLAEPHILQYHRCQVSFLSGALVAGRIQWHLKRAKRRTIRARFLHSNFIDHLQRRLNNILFTRAPNRERRERRANAHKNPHTNIV